MYDLIIIGSGPAGLSAAVYGKRAGLRLAVIEKSPMSGGQILNTYEVDNYLGLPGIGGFDMAMKFREHADGLGVDFLEAEVIEIKDGDKKCVRTDQGEFEARALIFAAGAEHASLGVPGEEEYAGRGVSYCATCDGAFYRGKHAAVVGGGDVALEDAVYLSALCEKVTVLLRRDVFRGASILRDRLLAQPNVEVLYETAVKEILGEDKRVCGLKIVSAKTGETFERILPVDGVFIAVGIRPNTELLRGIVNMDEQGYVLAGEECETNIPGIFVAGDARKKPLRQIITAVADGANAAIAAGKYLEK